MDEALVTVACYRDVPMAELAKGKLLAEGIECELQDEQTIAINWLWSDALGGVKLKVPKEREAEARLLLAEEKPGVNDSVETANVRSADERCPVCRAAEVRRVDGRRGAGAAVLLWTNLIPIWPIRWRSHHLCGVCGARWRPPRDSYRDDLHCPLDTGPERDPRALANAGRWLLLAGMAAVAVWMARHS